MPRGKVVWVALAAVGGAGVAAAAVVLVLSGTTGTEPADAGTAAQDGGQDAGSADGGDLPPGYKEARRSFARFIDGQLDECVTMTYMLPKGEDPAPLFEKAEKATTPIERDCAEQFKTRTTYAGCSVVKKVDRDGGPPLMASMIAYYFRTATAVDKDA